MRFLILFIALIPVSGFAEAFDRPIPQAQSATAELWFFLATLALIAALIAVARVVARR
ncbi:MAG: protein NnrT [Alphaproteobacteria bacterium]|nr:protein NnrT [Alphaproteobacteria bacterium]MBU1279535.1 protein NnrT [Alphaproteobacteria bacterium]MBU1574439.1 protein NnrT [Alphaproteobacteria bacterium]MBU1828016.1 protein NnrT [Alphaproteobacteria bacterium]MBU2077884.1 protein NnrT [Alphaproteobacteria bacterium]